MAANSSASRLLLRGDGKACAHSRQRGRINSSFALKVGGRRFELFASRIAAAKHSA